MSRRYPPRLIEPLLVSVEFPESYRIMPRSYLHSPLGTSVSDSRFASHTAGYTILYAGADFETAFIETVVRDRFVGRKHRQVALKEVTARIWVRARGRTGEATTLLDLGGDGCTRIGAPTDVVQARNHAAGRAFGRALHDEHQEVDGLVYARRA